MNFTPKNPNFKEAISTVLERQEFMKHIGFNLTKIEPGLMEGEIQFMDFLKQQSGFLHGGVIATLSDLVCGFAANRELWRARWANRAWQVAGW